MKKINSVMLSCILFLAGLGIVFANGDSIQVYENSIFSCQHELLIYELDEECLNDCIENTCPICSDSSCHYRCCDKVRLCDMNCFFSCRTSENIKQCECECQLNNCYENCSQTCLDECHIDMDDCLDTCAEDCSLPKNIGDITSTSYTFNLERCGQPTALSGVCLDSTVEPAINLGQCEYSPSNYRCELIGESFNLYIYYEGSGTITVNGRDYNTSKYKSPIPFLIYDSEEKDPDPRVFSQIPSSVAISADGEFNSGGFGIILERECCWSCVKKPLSVAILYPKVDIETFSTPGGATVIQDGKVISKFQMSPGSQQVFLQVENRGFFTQNDARVRFEGLPEGITAEVTPETQKITAHNIGSYSANFTVGPNVPSGTYQITMVAYSPNGMFDKITFEFVVQ